MLRGCRGRRIRAIGRLHSWSEAAVAGDVLVDMRHLQEVRVEERGGRSVGDGRRGVPNQAAAGRAARQAGATLPTLGLVTEQSITGAISTGTHGSGRPSMSHFVEEVRVATYDATGGPVIRTIDDGDELLSARCSLGALGVIVSVGFWARPRYNVQECFRQYGELDTVLAMEDQFPLQQFYLLPWSWRYVAQHRRETPEPRGGRAALYRLYFFLQFDLGLHLLVTPVVRWLRSARLVRFMFRHWIPRLVIQNWHVVDDASKMLVMEHELFRHIECEMFVSRSRLAEAVGLAVRLMKYFDGDAGAVSATEREEFGTAKRLRQLHAPLPDLHPPRAARRHADLDDRRRRGGLVRAELHQLRAAGRPARLFGVRRRALPGAGCAV